MNIISLLTGTTVGVTFSFILGLSAGIKPDNINAVVEIAGTGFAAGLLLGCIITFTIITKMEVTK
ncbi:Uncharacterized protein dnl_63050 [Desulfonema limicola]|uniref:Uncharacterized protein n=1 Tax=Desulfonema limicola TaxID=45656 RepID=A0A975BEC2_9BACT|nr:hypothetical protein [Desulfonema limicola]QTA83881.1 Uncharacterized protein dnl_63050 [Desulfonema limicola]